jgi:hypothetical protein
LTGFTCFQALKAVANQLTHKGDEKMSDQDQMNMMVQDLESYFSRATGEPYDRELAQPFIKKWGPKFAHMASAWVAQKIQRLSKFQETMMGISYSVQLVCILQNIYMAYGTSAGIITGWAISLSSDEDVKAFIAYVLASNELANISYCGLLREELKKVVGSSCKITLAYALHKCGDDSELLRLFESGYLCGKLMTQALQESGKEVYPQNTDQERQTILLDYVSDINPPEILGVIGILILDNWTQGGFVSAGFLAGLPWTRKVYPD